MLESVVGSEPRTIVWPTIPLFNNIAPEAAIIEPATGFGIVRLSATLIPIGFKIEPSLCTIDPGTTVLRIESGILPSVVIFGNISEFKISPDLWIIEPAGTFVVAGSATFSPAGLVIEPS